MKFKLTKNYNQVQRRKNKSLDEKSVFFAKNTPKTSKLLHSNTDSSNIWKQIPPTRFSKLRGLTKTVFRSSRGFQLVFWVSGTNFWELNFP